MKNGRVKQLLWIAVWLGLILSGCSKQETASEIMAKVQANQQKSDAVSTLKLEGQMTMAAQGLTLEFPVTLMVQTRPAEQPGEPVLYMGFETVFMGQSLNFEFCIQDQILYSEINGERNREPYPYTAEMIQSLQENPNMEKLYSAFTVNKSSSGYDLTFEAKSFAELAGLFEMMAETQSDEDALKELTEQFQNLDETLTLNQWKMDLHVSPDYHLTGGLMQIESLSNVEGTPISFSFDLNLTASMDQPMTTMDLSGWVM